MTHTKNSSGRDRLLATAKKIILTSGILSLSHETLAKEHGIGKSTCLYYFPSKAKLWQALIEDYVNHLDAQLNEFIAPYEKQGRPNALILAFADWYRSFRRPDNPWVSVGHQLMMLGADNPVIASPIRDWYQKLFARVQGEDDNSVMATMLLMVFDHLFNIRKLGYEVLDTAMEDKIIDRVIELSENAIEKEEN